MQTPYRTDLVAFTDTIIEEYTRTKAQNFQCHICDTKLATKVAYLSIHDSRFGNLCAGSGRVVKVAIPWCSQCETEPSDRGCLHSGLQLERLLTRMDFLERMILAAEKL